MNRYGRRLLAPSLVAIVALAGACTDNTKEEASDEGSGGSGPTTISVESNDTECTLSATKAPSGNVVFSVENTGGQVTEFYLLAEDGVAIIGEVENIGPGLSRDLVVRAEPGSYVTACKPGMTGDGIRGDFTVTDSGEEDATTGELKELEDAATAQYKSYVEQQVGLLVAGTQKFADAYKAGNDDEARALYAPTRAYWETIEPVAESFGDLDPRLDLREADLEEGQEWTGWHQIEKQLWPPAGSTELDTPEQRATMADRLVADTNELADRVTDVEFKADQLGNGAKELLDEVATGKVTGEEEAWSHTDLWDFQANVDGARLAYQALRPIVLVKDPDLAETLDAEFAAIQTELDKYRTADGFQYYDQLTQEQVKQLSDAVNALSEPLSQLTSVVVL
ncbi:iron uptake system protein EfeO [Dermatobacter hominis]|uniref:iron uptake system protein EfeO n=1 Tax=Dermatobacter hominis TaxID=2884263 RepID=UPI001D118638|nr:iron uptake system protein EfeO [Dermatobacter hominis]UDY35303.1 cupredoxin domain-containing protein [Dermatobacter hominis]